MEKLVILVTIEKDEEINFTHLTFDEASKHINGIDVLEWDLSFFQDALNGVGEVEDFNIDDYFFKFN